MCQENMGEVVVIVCICKEFSIRHAIEMIFLSFQIRKLVNLRYRPEISIALVSERPRTLRLSDQESEREKSGSETLSCDSSER